MNRSPKDILVIVKAAENRLKHLPEYGAMLLMHYVEDAIAEDFNGSPDSEEFGLKHLNLLFLESVFHDLRRSTVFALFDSTVQIRAMLPHREMAREHWQKVYDVDLQ